MKLKRILILLGVLAAIGVGGLAGFRYWDEHQQAAERERVTQEALAAKERHHTEETMRVIDSFRMVQDYDEPSQGRDSYRAQLLERIVQTKSRFIVFPPSAPMYRANLDLTARIAIARQIAQMIETETGVPVPDPALVFEAYGAPRRIDPELIPVHILDSQVQWIIAGHASHDGHGKMTIRLTKIPFKASRPPVLPVFERAGIAISDEHPPEAAFQPMAAEALRALGFKGTPIALTKLEAPPELPLPKSPAEAATREQSAIEGLWLQQLIGVLHHSTMGMDPRPRERVFERVLGGLNGLSPESGDYPVLMARTLTYVGRPIAAAKTLESAGGTPEGKALRAYLAGDLPALRTAVVAIRREIPRLIAECELLDLRTKFGELSQTDQHTEAERLGHAVPEVWRALVTLFIAHQSLWTLPVPSQLKPLMDRDFAVEGYGAADITRGKAALGGSPMDAKTATDLFVSPLVHAAKWRAANPEALCCEQGSGSLQRYDRVQYLDLLVALAAGEIAGGLDFQTHVQGHPEAALRQADLYDQALFHGLDTQIMAARIEALEAFTSQEPERAGGMQASERIAELAKKILSWDSAQSYATADAFVADNRIAHRNDLPDRLKGKILPTVDSSLFDFPRRPVWALRASHWLADQKMMLALQRDACRLTVGAPLPCSRYLATLKPSVSDQEYRKEVAAMFESHFNGSGTRAVLLSESKIQNGDLAGAEAMLKEAIASSQGPGGVYSELGELQMRDGRYAEAAKTYLDYPELKSVRANTVGLSNYLEPAAFAFLERGALTQARQLFSIVAGYRDGSYANYAGVAQFALMDGKYDLAREVLQAQYQRYHSNNGMRRLLSLLFMMGKSEDAWSALKSEAEGDPTHISVIGLRMADADATRIAAWTAEDADRVKNYWQPLRIAFLVLTLDRPAASVRAIYEVDAKARAAMKSFVVKEPLLSEIKAAGPGDTYLPPPALIEGYAAVKERDYAKAMISLQPLYESPEAGQESYALRKGQWAFAPYLALAVSKTGKGDDAIALDQRFRGANAGDPAQAQAASTHAMPDFHHHLMLAIGHAFNAHHTEAQAEVQKARATLKTADMIDSGYIYVEILERLSEETRQPAYLNAALDYARAHQLLEPWTSWAYAFEARHSPAGTARIRAAGIALKLDPQSQWLRELDKSSMAQARQWAAANRWPGKVTPIAPANRV